MPAPFGFSAGDFIALTQLIFQVSKALSDSKGSQAEYQSLVQTLLSLLRTINVAEELALRCTLDNSVSRDPAILAPLNAIAREREICQRLIEDFMTRSQKYTASFIHGSGRAKAIKKITWLLFHSSDVEKLERELKIHTDAIHFYTCGLGFQSLQASIASNALVLGQIDSRTTMMYEMISQIFSMMPKALGYTWEGGCAPDEKPLRLLDALGRDLMIPSIFLSSREVFQDTLEIIHRGLPGHRKILMLEYNVADEDGDGTVIDKTKDHEWAKIVRAGKTVSLNMIFQTFLHNKDTQTCPRCKSIATGPTLEGRRRRCQRCQLTFHIFEEVRLEETKNTASEHMLRDQSLYENAKDERKQPVKQRPKPDQKAPRTREQDLFRRIHYIHETVQRRDSGLTEEKQSGKLESKDQYMDDLPPLHEAAARGDLKTLKRLLDDDKLDIESKGGCDSATPLHYAAYQGRQEAAIFLLQRGAVVESRDCDGATPLHWAIPFGHLSMLQLLLESGASIHCATTRGRTPLHWCAWKNQLAIARFLVEEGADVNALDEDNSAPLLHICGVSAELVQLLVDEGADVNSQANNSRSAIHFAAEECPPETVNLLLELGADVNAADCQQATPLMLAIRREQDAGRVCRILLDRGADVRRSERSLLAEAAVSRDALSVLLEYDIDINLRDSNGRTPLHIAAGRGDHATCRQLLAAGADVDAQDNDGNTALHIAIPSISDEPTRILLQFGARMLVNGYLEEPLHKIQRHTPAETVLRLIARGANVNATNGNLDTPLHKAAENANAPCIATLIEQGAELDKRNEVGEAPVHVAARHGSIPCCELFLEAGVSIEISVEASGRVFGPLLWYAACFGSADVVAFLLSRGANPLGAGTAGRIPLHAAATTNALDSARVLLADDTAEKQLEARTISGRTPLNAAAAMGHLDMVNLLATHAANKTHIELKDILDHNADTIFQQDATKWYHEVYQGGLEPTPE